MRISRPILAIAVTLLLGPYAAADVPRTPSGHPDLSGTYDGATLTPLVRPANTATTCT